ncbi:hypothetical protein ACIQW5_26925 [Methylorubrum thiocyanatum]|uniref:hypothetical protein n=1 Tax=Methylorubrum thiocyanatum TaxID=47958 RepID=UPI00383B1EDB
MSNPKRPSLSSLVERKPAETTRQDEAAPDRAPPAPAPTDLKTMQVRVNRAGWLEMTRLAQDLDMPLEALMVAAFNDALVKHGKPPVVERRQPVKG